MATEGNLTAPTRHAIDWKGPDYYNEDAWRPELATKKFPSGAPNSKKFPLRDGAKTPGKVAIYSTCYVNYNDPGIGLDLLRRLDHHETP